MAPTTRKMLFSNRKSITLLDFECSVIGCTFVPSSVRTSAVADRNRGPKLSRGGPRIAAASPKLPGIGTSTPQARIQERPDDQLFLADVSGDLSTNEA